VVSAFALISDMLKPELEGFFVDYHRLSGEQFRAIGVKGPNNARKRIKDTEAVREHGFSD
jgi:hypothetical protein